MNDIKTIIQSELNKIEKERDIKIIHAIESGSRAWGFPSPDSDYDVRFIYVHSKDWYLSVFNRRDVIELPIDDVLDISGWDLKKACRLINKANAALYEWLSSPIIYRQMPKPFSILADIAKRVFNAVGIFHHYKAMTKRKTLEIRKQEKVRLKTYLYALRSAFCCEWIIKYETQPALLFDDLQASFFENANEPDLKTEIADILEKKKEIDEKERMPRSKIIDDYLTKALERFDATQLTRSVKIHTEEIDQAFLEILNGAVE